MFLTDKMHDKMDRLCYVDASEKTYGTIYGMTASLREPSYKRNLAFGFYNRSLGSWIKLKVSS